MEFEKDMQVRIAAIIDETKDARTFELEPLGWTPVYKAGQFITFIFPTPFGEKRRSYSISSSPLLHEPLRITVKKVDNGEFSRWFVYKAAVGDMLLTAGTNGFFTGDHIQAQTKQVFFLAAGSGITPCYAIVKTLLATSTQKVVLIYSNKDAGSTLFLEPLMALQHRYPDKFRLRLLYSTSSDVYNRRLGNWLLSILLREYLLVKKEEAVFYVCGPFDYMLTVSITLLGEGFAASQIRKEIFTPPAKPAVHRPPDTDVHVVTLHVHTMKHVLRVQYPLTILAVAKQAGIEVPYSCESGSCGACAATCVHGKVWMAYNEVLTDKDLEKGRVLTCQGYAVGGDVEIVY